MSYRNGTYIAFHAGGTSDPTASDIKYFNLLKGWRELEHLEFNFVNSHEKTGAVRDTSSRETLRRSLRERLNNSKNMLLIVSDITRLDDDWVPFEIQYAVDTCNIPIICAYPGYQRVNAPKLLSRLWPYALSSRITNGSARVMHIAFALRPVADAIKQFDLNNTTFNTGYGYYGDSVYAGWGL